MKTSNSGNFVLEASANSFDDAILQEQILHSNDRKHHFDHSVQFYEKENSLLASLSEFTAKALKAGEAVIIVATRAHRKGLEKRLHKNGFDISAARASGQFLALDASETLSKFMRDDSPEPVLFSQIVGSILAQAASGGRRVRVFGEMVALLLAEGKPLAAINLENLWNDLSKTHSFTLFCAYPINGFDGEPLAEVLSDVCAGHVRVIPAESYTEIVDTDHRNRTIVGLQRKARLLEKEIAERKRVEQERLELLASEKAARIRAEEASRMKDEFLATVSHELRTPLNSIIGWSRLLADGRLDEKTATRAVETIHCNAKAQAQIVGDILDMSRVITGKLCLKIEPVDIALIINAAIESVQAAADSKGIQITTVLDASACHIFADASRLQQIMWNLLSNAIKFTPSCGYVKVRLERADSDIKISVGDSGKGIDRDFLPFIFDNFRQDDGSSTRCHGGLGLGLAIVRRLVELHGGTVQAESKGEGKGSIFTIRLPQIARG